ncbi:MAG TPA: hypothetical protein VMH88_15380 [Gemmatimonadales bacterium]|nr:hypothetical protein [Gemmatimonadales bacterium]
MRPWLHLLLLLPLLACSDGSGPARTTRTYRMGFSAIPPTSDQAVVFQNLELWTKRADAAIMHQSVPWGPLLGGTPAGVEVDSVERPLANYYRGKGLRLVITIDVTNGLDRSAQDPTLVALGHSITEPAIQALYRQYVLALDTILHPDYLGLAAETNLIRYAAPDSVYQAVVAMTNAAAGDIAAHPSKPVRYVSVQVEVAWGLLQGSAYAGIAQDLHDFPFVEAIGLSSYPYLAGIATPEDIPLDYYSRIADESARPVLVVEGGWSSATLGSIMSSQAEQARYITRQAELLDRARAVGVFQLTFADLALSSFPPQPPGSILPLFASLGLVDTTLAPKAALTPWDELFARPFAP